LGSVTVTVTAGWATKPGPGMAAKLSIAAAVAVEEGRSSPELDVDGIEIDDGNDLGTLRLLSAGPIGPNAAPVASAEVPDPDLLSVEGWVGTGEGRLGCSAGSAPPLGLRSSSGEPPSLGEAIEFRLKAKSSFN